MNTSAYENSKNLLVVESYYKNMLNKNLIAMEECLHPDVHFLTPLAEILGKTGVVEAAKNLSAILEGIDIRAKFSSGDKIMMAYDFMFPQPIGKLKSAVLMELKQHLITKIELFYDGRPFEKKKKEIFPINKK